MARGATVTLACAAAVAFSSASPSVLPDAPSPSERRLVTVPERGPDDWLVAQRAGEGSALPLHAYEDAVGEAIALRAEAKGRFADAAWELRGPRSVGGRVVDVVVDPDEATTVYAAAATGGVWKSTDAGSTFTPAWSARLTQSMGALAIDADGTLWAGTGEANPGGGSIVYGGSGVYRSTNGGETWKSVGLQRSGAIGRIVVDPSDPKTVWVAASGPLYRKGGQRGLYLTRDGGKTWRRVLEGANPTTGAIDVAVDPSNPERVYAAMWDHIRLPDLRVYGGVGSGLFRTDDGGKTWSRVEGGFPGAKPTVGRIGVAVAPSRPDVVYAVVIRTDGIYEGFYRSLDGGDTWESSVQDITLDLSQSTFGWWFGRVWVDPLDPLHVFAAGVYLAESLDGGATWSLLQAGNIHADQHAMAWHPTLPNVVYLGNDGGVYRSATFGTGDVTWVPAEDQPFVQFYSLDVSEQDPSRITGGAQDNGSLRNWGIVRKPECATSAGCIEWNNYLGGDGLRNLINPEDQDNVFACWQYGNCSRSENGGETMTSFTGQTTSTRRGWFTPLEFDPGDPNVMYYGGNILNRSTDNGRTWTAISPDLTGGPGRDRNYPYGTITTIAPAASDADVVYVGTDDGRVWRTSDAGEHWRRLGTRTLPKRWVTRLAVDPRDEDLVYVTFSGYRSGVLDPAVLASTNGGRTWKNITSNLPNAPTNDVVIGGRNLFVATDVGVFVRGPNGRWGSVGKELPVVPVTDLRFHEPSQTLFAATFGRGIYSVALSP